MKIVIAPDSFKGSLASSEVAQHVARAFKDVHPELTVIQKPMADGGEGTIDALAAATDHKRQFIRLTGPLGDPIESSYLILGDDTVVIEAASVLGLTLVPSDQRNPEETTSTGLGEAIVNALDHGYRKFMIALGGSSTNDGGLGILQALGLTVQDNNGKEVGSFGKDLYQIDSVNKSTLDPRLKDCTFKIACDVSNPLTGSNGASHVYGPQKGASKEQVKKLDEALDKWGRLLDKSMMDTPGAGAAGGLGFSFLTLEGDLESGAHLVSEAIKLEEAIKDADLLITGEGKSDEQTLHGKAPAYVADLGADYGVPTILLSGSIEGDRDALRGKFMSSFSIVPSIISLDDCMKYASDYLYDTSVEVARLWGHILERSEG
ncbi:MULTISPECIES: glycerate kinase [Pontibacillus]|uniref:Glycerate kinase n=1 Tax=Pontibacillus chungwhensis TaxID=265426 RepID=A0ABY8UTQ0_9BACI|nr:glycerate kinase [Pontibacillus chungwhensis]MCD5323329.1 glycerate kinase [Pontibacillus sp. HN14]WIF96710.1 glycerate kinase [Pontibacillus chungwhensis]